MLSAIQKKRKEKRTKADGGQSHTPSNRVWEMSRSSPHTNMRSIVAGFPLHLSSSVCPILPPPANSYSFNFLALIAGVGVGVKSPGALEAAQMSHMTARHLLRAPSKAEKHGANTASQLASPVSASDALSALPLIPKLPSPLQFTKNFGGT